MLPAVSESKIGGAGGIETPSATRPTSVQTMTVLLIVDQHMNVNLDAFTLGSLELVLLEPGPFACIAYTGC